MNQKQFLRKANLLVVAGSKGIDLSEMRFVFQTSNADTQSPSNVSIRVYNLSEKTAASVRSEYNRVVLQAGCENSSYGVIFDGTIKQFRKGRESAVDTYLDILAADGDIGYNFGICSESIEAKSNGVTPNKVVTAAVKAMGLQEGNLMEFTGGVLPRGKVLFGMGRDILKNVANSQGATWSIQSGRVQITPLTGYLPGEAVGLNSLTGMIGIPEQTEEGIKVRCLLNPKLRIGGLVKLNSADINQLFKQNPNAAPIPFNQWTGIQNLATVTNDGIYRLYVVEHFGDTRGSQWYSDLICLAVDPSSKKVEALD